MKRSILHKSGLLLPALAWLFIQFAMTGVLAGSSADAMQIEVCLPSGVQTITIDPETGEPAAPSVTGGACDWCQSFGVAVDTAARGDVGWMAIARDY